MMIMISANSLLTMYLGLETLALSICTRWSQSIALERDVGRIGDEVLRAGCDRVGACCTASPWVYGVTGTLKFDEIAAGAAADPS